MVPDLLPFAGLRYRLDALDVGLEELTAPPYDVIDDETRVRLEAAHPDNAVHLILPRDEAPGDRYRRAAGRLARWRADGVVAPDPPGLYVYRMAFSDGSGARRTMTGVLGALALSPSSEGRILPHERTLPKPRSDRLDLLRATRANLDPVWGLSQADGLSARLDGPGSRPLGACVDPDGVEHSLAALAPGAVAAVREVVGSAPVVLADGHHRYETALAYRAEREAEGTADPAAGFILALVVELAEDQLHVRPIHRLLTGLTPGWRERLAAVAHIGERGENTAAGVARLRAEMDERGALGLVEPSGVALLTLRTDVLAAALARLPEPLRPVDSARLEVALDHVAGHPGSGGGAGEPGGPLGAIDHRNDAASVADLVAKGSADAAILLRAPSVAEIRAVAAAGLRMPEKTTFFCPKPLTGMVFRAFDGA